MNNRLNCEKEKFYSNYDVNAFDKKLKLTPVLWNSIIDSVVLDRNEYIILNPISFNIYPSRNIYCNNDKVCINNITYSYDYIGLPSPISYYIYNNKYNFNGICSEYLYEKNSIPIKIQIQIAMNKREANEIINTADLIQKIDDMDEKFQVSIDTVKSLGSTFITTASTLKDLIENQYPEPVAGSLEDILISVINSIIYVSQAGYYNAILLEQFTTSIIEKTVLKIYNSSSEYESEVYYLFNSSDFIINYPDVPAESVKLANQAKYFANNLKNTVNGILQNLEGQTFLDINDTVIQAILDAGYPYDALYILNDAFGNIQIKKYLDSIENILTGLYYFAYSVRQINRARELPKEAQNQALNEAAELIKLSSQFIIKSLNYDNVVDRIYLYNTLKSSFSYRDCNKDMSNNVNFSKSELLFHEQLNSFKIANLVIEVNGTIGNKDFKAVSNNDFILELGELGLMPININAKISGVRNKNNYLIQDINPMFTIDSIISAGNYNINTPDCIIAEIIGCLYLKIELITSIKNPLPVYTIDKYYK